MNAVLGSFAAAWVGYFALLVLLPIHYTSVEFADALAVLAIYVFLSIGCALVLQSVLSTDSYSRKTLRTVQPLSGAELEHLIIAGLLASTVGMLLIAYVRVAVQGINYTQGLAVARELWREEGTAREGISSPLSIPGYGLGFFFLASTFIAHLHWEQLSRSVKRAVITGTPAFVAGYAVLTGGRSVLLTQIISILAAATIRSVQRRRAFPGRFSRTLLFNTAAVIAAVAYALYIFSERAAGTLGVTPETYVQAAIAFMGASTTEGFLRISSWPQPLATAANFAILAGAYITHSAGTLASVMEYSTHHGITVFGGVWDLLSRFNLATPGSGDWVLAGAFLSLPGAFWYQFGILGVLVAAVVSGVCMGVVCQYIRGARGGGISVGFAAASLITTLISPLIFAPDSLAFPFMILGYVGLGSYSRVVFGARNWWLVGRQCQLAALAPSSATVHSRVD
jgi:hypothetical protein